MSDLIGNISIWFNVSENPKAPQWRGSVQDENRKIIYDIALWRNESDNAAAPVITGKLSKPFRKDGSRKVNNSESSVF